ncbi:MULTISPECIES: LysR family transcriptional regulator [unclassified Ruegeria]|uniref:LysR family transcriptional regulator n=1 Tax=unclassified Ruegeria TaxID=2625375 RepID=UPI0014892809|nr:MULTISPECIES: LysR family transcriptional regulator [unclassified Ruegeria]
MEKSDYLEIDGRQLRILLTIRQAGSLSGAAKMLDMNQSTVSYWLDQMRKRIGDPLFVRSGNGVEPTMRAQELFPAVEASLRHLQEMFEPQDYDPAQDQGVLRLTGTTVERGLFYNSLLHHALEVAPRLSVEIYSIGSAFQMSERLRQNSVDIVIMPVAAESGDGILLRKLFTLTDAVYFDPDHPLEQGNLDAFCERPQARVAFGPDAGFGVDRRLAKMHRSRHVAIQVSDFDSALDMIRGTPIIATLPRQLATQGLNRVDPPWLQEGLDIAMFWHARNQTSSRHKYWRDTLAGIAARLGKI